MYASSTQTCRAEKRNDYVLLVLGFSLVEQSGEGGMMEGDEGWLWPLANRNQGRGEERTSKDNRETYGT